MSDARRYVQQGAKPAGGEERAAPRFTLLIRAAKLQSAKGEFVCVIRDVSESGVSLRSFHAPPTQGPFNLVLQTGESHPIEPVWQNGADVGFRFAAPVDVHAIVSEKGSYPKRSVRLSLQFPVVLVVNGAHVAAEISDLSRQGARISTDARLAIAQPLRVVAPLLPAIDARVRWRNNLGYGLVFDTTLTLQELATIAARFQSPELLDPGAAEMRSRA